jgi:hypothetical protein
MISWKTESRVSFIQIQRNLCSKDSTISEIPEKTGVLSREYPALYGGVDTRKLIFEKATTESMTHQNCGLGTEIVLDTVMKADGIKLKRLKSNELN